MFTFGMKSCIYYKSISWQTIAYLEDCRLEARLLDLHHELRPVVRVGNAAEVMEFMFMFCLGFVHA